LGARPSMAIEYKSDAEIEKMREAGRIVGRTLQLLARAVEPGRNVLELEKIVEEEFKKAGADPTFLGYPGPYPYPSNVCVSINDEIVHGIPTDRVMRDGDIVSIDLGATWKGFVGDSAITVGCGEISKKARHLIEITEGALWAGIKAARTGNRMGDVGHAIDSFVKPTGYGVVREYVGHGVGRNMHEDPQVPNYGEPNKGPLLKRGLAIAIEPMVNLGTWKTKKMKDGWTIKTADGSLSAHFEHTIAIRDGEAEVLTLPG
jgi:methionyl aminopeptidase